MCSVQNELFRLIFILFHMLDYHQEEGDLLWEYNVGHPITASAYVDEHLLLESDASNSSDRLTWSS